MLPTQSSLSSQNFTNLLPLSFSSGTPKAPVIQRRKARIAFLDGDEIEREGRGIMVSGFNVIFASVQEMERARERVALLLNDVWHSAVVKFESVSFRILWIKFKFSRVKVCL